MEGFTKQVYQMWNKAFWKKINQYLSDLWLSEKDKNRIIWEIKKKK